ncbi:MAG: hypothetical protein Q7S23_03765 [bacterium]|nr:hypothetical protein [bacterium]
MNTSRLLRTIGIFGVIVVVAVAVVGPVVMSRMAGHQHGASVSGCPFQGMAAVCPMTAVDHVGLWRQLLAGFAPTTMLLGFILLSAFIVVTLRSRLSSQHWKKRRWRGIPRYLTQHPLAMLSDFLHQALAAGILQPKVFPARVS